MPTLDVLQGLSVKKIIKNWLVGRMNKSVASSYYFTAGILHGLSEGKISLTTDDARTVHQNTLASLKKFMEIYNKLEKSRFFENDQLKKYSSDLLNNLYSLENEFRTLSYPGKQGIPEDKELIDSSTSISHYAVFR